MSENVKPPNINRELPGKDKISTLDQPSDASTSGGPTNNSTVDHTPKLPPDLSSHSHNAQTSSDSEKSVLQTASASVFLDIVSKSSPKHSYDPKIPVLLDISTSGVYSDEMVAVNQPSVKEETHNEAVFTPSDPKVMMPWDDSELEAKDGNKRLRWNLLFNILLLTIIPAPIWLPFASMELAVNILPILQMLLMSCWLVVTFSAWVTYIKLLHAKNKVFQPRKSYEHLVVISSYKEPTSLLISTIESIELQESCRTNVNLTLSFEEQGYKPTRFSILILIFCIPVEERTPELNTKINDLTLRFSKKFKRLIFTKHPYGLAGEIPGKCSNANHGIRESMARLHHAGVNTDELIVTTCDADTKFHPVFLNALAERFSDCKDPHQSVFQSPLLYNWKLDEATVVTRVTGIMRATLMMGALIPFNINTMSVFSFSGKLCKAGNFIHPNYQMDDIIALIRWMGVAGKRLNIVMVPVPTLSGPTSGRVVEEEITEWARQARRWTIGAGEVFHYFMIKSKRIPFFTALSWGLTFIIYYGILLCCSHLYGVTLSISYAFFLPKDAVIFGTNTPISDLIIHVSLFLLYFNSLSMFILDWLCPKLLVPQPEEYISIVRNICHFVISPLVILGYSLIEFWSIFELAIRGKKVCNHKPSKKTELVMTNFAKLFIAPIMTPKISRKESLNPA